MALSCKSMMSPEIKHRKTPKQIEPAHVYFSHRSVRAVLFRNGDEEKMIVHFPSKDVTPKSKRACNYIIIF